MTIVLGTPEANALLQPSLESCPFCGSAAAIECAAAGQRWVERAQCAARGPRVFIDDQRARLRWNRRGTEVQP